MRDLSEQTRKALVRLAELEVLMGDPAIHGDRKRAKLIGSELKRMQSIAAVGRTYLACYDTIAEANEIISGDDAELADLAAGEKEEAEARLPDLTHSLERLLIPTDPDDDKNLILEIRAGTGGDEAGLFAFELYRMYERYAEAQNWKLETLSSTEGAVGGLKEIVASVKGEGAFGHLKYESGVHRVQRVPSTEASGRIHTSAASVAVLPEVEEIDAAIDANDLRIDVYRSSGPGGQSVNTTDSAVRITHVPTGLVVSCQDEKSQHKNKAKALKILAARLYDKMRSEQQAEISAKRRDMVGTGDRSAKIRTYNFPQSRVTDHRIGVTQYNLPAFMEGDLKDMIDALILHAQELQLSEDLT